jgi:hypothetical protein
VIDNLHSLSNDASHRRTIHFTGFVHLAAAMI